MWYLPEIFAEDSVIGAYIVALVVAGLLTIVLGSINSGLGSLARLGTVALGLALLGYGLYVYFFLPESVLVFWYVFVVPVLIVAKVVKSLVERHEASQDVRDAPAPTGEPA